MEAPLMWTEITGARIFSVSPVEIGPDLRIHSILDVDFQVNSGKDSHGVTVSAAVGCPRSLVWRSA